MHLQRRRLSIAGCEACGAPPISAARRMRSRPNRTGTRARAHRSRHRTPEPARHRGCTASLSLDLLDLVPSSCPKHTCGSAPRTAERPPALAASRIATLCHRLHFGAIRGFYMSPIPPPCSIATGCPGCSGPMRKGRIISLSSCSTMWQCHTNCPGLRNRARTRVTCPG